MNKVGRRDIIIINNLCKKHQRFLPIADARHNTTGCLRALPGEGSCSGSSPPWLCEAALVPSPSLRHKPRKRGPAAPGSRRTFLRRAHCHAHSRSQAPGLLGSWAPGLWSPWDPGLLGVFSSNFLAPVNVNAREPRSPGALSLVYGLFTSMLLSFSTVLFLCFRHLVSFHVVREDTSYEFKLSDTVGIPGTWNPGSFHVVREDTWYDFRLSQCP